MKTNVYLPPSAPSPRWARVKPEDIGSGFKTVSEASLKVPAYAGVDTGQVYKNRFFSGRSRHILFFVRSRKVEVPKTKPKVPPVNLEYKLKPQEKAEFAQTLKRSQKKVANLLFKDLLPFTMSLNTAVFEVRDKIKQITDDDVGLPMDFILRKTLSVVELRILRMLIEAFNINKEEASILMEEYKREKVPKDRSPSQVPGRGSV